MAKVYEAMLQATGAAPDATPQIFTAENLPDGSPAAYATEADPLDLTELGLMPAPPLLSATNAVATDVAVAEAIADSVSTLAHSFAPERPAPAYVPEAYRAEFQQLGEIVMRTAAQRLLKTVVVCGVEPDDYADFVAENLSLALAENPALRVARFGLVTPATAVAQAQTEAHFRIKIQRTAIPNLCHIVPLHGSLALAQVLRECDVAQMFELLKSRFDFVLLETDAVNFADEVATFAGQADGVILVAQKSNMRGPAMSVAREKLQRASAQILGAVLNRNRAPQQYQRVA
jgi:hypothetical protein